VTGPARVRWRPGAAGGNLLGYVGTLPSWAFQIFTSGDPAEGRKMIAQLPGLAGTVARDPDPDVLKDEAEGWLVGFVAAVGAVFPKPAGHARQPLRMSGRQAQPRLCSCGEPWPCDGARNWHYGWAEDSRDGDGNLILRYEPSGGLYKILPVEEC
jgi:hypothetical protein